MSDKKMVVYQGVEMIEGWPAQIEAAQLDLTYTIRGKAYPRIRYGDESHNWKAAKIPCGDCSVIVGQLHVRRCDIEECPACHEQALTCGCLHDGSAEWVM